MFCSYFHGINQCTTLKSGKGKHLSTFYHLNWFQCEPYGWFYTYQDDKSHSKLFWCSSGQSSWKDTTRSRRIGQQQKPMPTFSIIQPTLVICRLIMGPNLFWMKQLLTVLCKSLMSSAIVPFVSYWLKILERLSLTALSQPSLFTKATIPMAISAIRITSRNTANWKQGVYSKRIPNDLFRCFPLGHPGWILSHTKPAL